MADDDETDDGAVEELFPGGYIEGGKTTLKTLIKPGQDHKVTVALSRAEVPLRGGLPDPDKHIRALVTGIFQKVTPTAQREDAGNPMKVTGWKSAVSMRVDYVENVPETDDALIEQRFRAMLEVEPSAAAALLDRLKALTAEQLSAV